MRPILLLVLLPAVALGDVRYRGEARDVLTNALLYHEEHLLRTDADTPRERLVLYRCASGVAFARKHVTYRNVPAAPEFELADARDGYREGARRAADMLDVFFQPDRRRPEQRARIESSDALVIDAGFDSYLQQHWAALQEGDKLALDFLVPSRLATLRFTLVRSGGMLLDGEPASVFRLRVGGVIGWFAPDIEVTYRDRDRRLVRFEGLTNIRNGDDGNLTARIDFTDAQRQTGVSSAEWEAAAGERLVDCGPGR